MALEALANEIKDIEDPSSFDKVLFYFEDLQSEAEDYMELLVKKLQFRDITWEQPWYQAPSTIVKVHQPFYQRNEVDTEKFRTDKITKDEHDRINKNWQRFTKKYNVPDKLRLFVGWKNRLKGSSYVCDYVNSSSERGSLLAKERARQFIVAYLARGLERTLQQVFIYVQFYHLKEQGDVRVYNEYEKKIMEVCFMHKLDKAPPILSLVLGRHIRGLYKRRTELKSEKPEKRRVKWSIERAGKFLKGILEYSELPLSDLKYKTFEKSFWLKLEEEMDLNYGYLHFFWYTYLHVQLFVQCDVKLYKIRRKLFKLLRDSSYKIWTDIRWAELLDNFPNGCTIRFLYKLCYSIVRKYPSYLKTPVSDLATFGLQTIKSYRYANKRLKRLTVNDEGKLEVIKHNPEEKNS